MIKKSNLKFLLALGSAKVILLEENQQMHMYASTLPTSAVHVQRIKEAVSTLSAVANNKV